MKYHFQLAKFQKRGKSAARTLKYTRPGVKKGNFQELYVGQVSTPFRNLA